MALSYWRGKTALVTGASGGLGKALAMELARAGARVAICARGAEQLEQAAAELRTCGAKILPVVADVTRQEDVDRLLEVVVKEFGRLDMLINNAGRSTRGEVLATTPGEFRELMELNLVSMVRVTRAAMPQLLAAKGHLVNIGSLAAKSAARYLGAYPASKFAVAAYTQQLRLELEPQGLKVLLACPGPIARDERRQYAGAETLPASAQLPGGGVKVSRLTPERVARATLRAAEQRQAELILPGKARLLFVVAALSPRLGDWLLRKWT